MERLTLANWTSHDRIILEPEIAAKVCVKLAKYEDAEELIDENEIFTKIQTTQYTGVRLSPSEEQLIKLAVKECKLILSNV